MKYLIIVALCMIVWSGGWGEDISSGTIDETYVVNLPWCEGWKLIEVESGYVAVPPMEWLMVEIMRIECSGKLQTGWERDSLIDSPYSIFDPSAWVYGWRPTYQTFCDTIIDTVWIRGIEP